MTFVRRLSLPREYNIRHHGTTKCQHVTFMSIDILGLMMFVVTSGLNHQTKQMELWLIGSNHTLSDLESSINDAMNPSEAMKFQVE